MSNASQQIVNKAWNFAHVLRDDGLSYMACTEQITFLLFLNAANRHERKATWTDDTPEGRWRSFTDEELLKRDKLNLDIFWLKYKSLEDSDNLPEPDVLAQEIIDDLEDALVQLRSVASELK